MLKCKAIKLLLVETQERMRWKLINIYNAPFAAAKSIVIRTTFLSPVSYIYKTQPR